MKTKINLAYSWNSVSKDTIINCFKKAGIGNSSKKLAVTETDGSFKVLIEDLSHLWELDQNVVQEKLSAESYLM